MLKFNKYKALYHHLIYTTKGLLYRLKPPVINDNLFEPRIILHFSYHKCLTVYYHNIMSSLGNEMNFSYKHYNADKNGFEKDLTNLNKKCVLSLNNHSNLNLDKYPEFKGSHFIRDPRDLVVSGYRYHLWTDEKWCRNPSFDWSYITNHPYFSKYIENKNSNYPINISYQKYLNSLDTERGLILELIWRQHHFNQMGVWNYNSESIIEYKYEDIIGNEVECFNKIFEHYGLHSILIERGLEIVEKLSLKNMKKSETGHVRKGVVKQWETEFSPFMKKIFKDINGDLLLKLGYERNNDW